MSTGHPYRSLRVPDKVPFELRPSPGKGWGAFATRRIARGSRILSEKPIFIIRRPHTEITDDHVTIAFKKLLPKQKAQFLLLHDNGAKRFTSMNEAFAENSFNIANSDRNEPEAHGLFPLHSRFNHSCIPNAKIPNVTGEVISSFATKDIHAGEEINFCYNTDFECRTRYERHQALRFTCQCMACLPGTSFRRLSDIRRRLIRGLQYLTRGVDLDRNGQKQTSHPIIVDSKLRMMAETFSIPLSSRWIYALLTIFFLEEEGLLDDFMEARLRPSLTKTVQFFKSESNQSIVRKAMQQNTWLKKLQVGFKLYGREDAVDYELTLALRRLR
ncbi:uncharacterized protein N7479_003298 [Penicillium vulpinum]|uniref:SET domain-containing protein n=1 Tax=Penicillium vulpinum TaxID=29845 RepID=A0A1V6S3P7_9EURO|nr:uncharacterized protein N7479_003298 [Penicillium vulpinum]KAJ5963422.1 hypothetical protein N7479_003298 [Penicillium vulpinum]OQE08675.1 hypothetical protein PENVUL_c009G03958 [Penicillium vulpinum]